MKHNNMKPLHASYQSFESDSTHTTSYNFHSGQSKAFKTFTSFESDSTHTVSQISGYQYGAVTAIACSFQDAEPIGMIDEWSFQVTKIFDEPVLSSDSTFTGKIPFTDYVDILDSAEFHHTKYFEDGIAITDSGSAQTAITDQIILLDSWSINYTKLFEEVIGQTDSSDEIYFQQAVHSTVFNADAIDLSQNTGEIAIDGYVNDQYTSNIVSLPYNLAAVTDVSGASNPLKPSLSVDGTMFVNNPETIFTPPAVGTFVRIDNAAIAGITLCQTNQVSMTLDYNGGSFTVQSTGPITGSTNYLDNLNQQVSILGFQATIDTFGWDVNSKGKLYSTSGSFAPPNMHKPFSIITYGNQQFLQFMGSVQLFAVPRNNTATTVMGMAMAVAAAAGVTVSWAVPDAPYKDTIGQSGQTALEALGSLASQVGATLRWNGDSTYIVTYPDFYAGVWSIPSAKLVLSYSPRYLLDLGLGLTGTGVIGIPVNTLYDVGTKELPNSNASNVENIERIASVTKPLTSNDPPIIVDLPNDIISVKIQILVPNNQFVAANYVTANDSIWYDLATPGVSNPYLRLIKVGNAHRHQLVINSTLFPNLAAINNGNFTMNFGIVRQNLRDDFTDAQEEAEQNLKDLIAQIQANIRFIKTYSATITLKFFGSIPLPGMWTSFTYCGDTVEGIIESVNLSNDTITIEVAQYLRVNLIDRKLQWDLTSGQYS